MDNPSDLTNPSMPSWDANQKLPNLRPPRQEASTEPTTSESCGTSTICKDPTPVLKPHRLSADAKEFVPKITHSPKTMESCMGAKEFHPRHSQSPETKSAPAPAKKLSMQNRMEMIRNPNANGTDTAEDTTNTYNQSNYADSASSTNMVVKRLNEYMQEIIVKPGRFDALARMLIDEIVSWFGDGQVAAAVVDAIVSQAIIERNFQYNGARLCSLLSAELDISDPPVFKNHLFERVKQEYTKILPDVKEQPSKAFGFVGFLGEVYSQMGKVDSSHSLGGYFLDIVEVLVSVPTTDSIKRVSQLLKLTGGMLDKEDKPKMDSVIAKLMEAGYKTNTTHIVGSVVTLRQQNWGEEVGTETKDAVIDTSLSGQPCLQSEAIQYGPDGLALSKEESEFLNGALSMANSSGDAPDVEECDDFGDEYAPFDDDEMDEEMQEAFSQFLIESKQV